MDLRWPIVTNKMRHIVESVKIVNSMAEVNCTANFVTRCPNNLKGKVKHAMHLMKVCKSNQNQNSQY